MIKMIKKLLKLSFAIVAVLALAGAYAPSIAPEIRFFPITGLIELLENAEKSATGLIPDGIKDLVSMLSKAVD